MRPLFRPKLASLRAVLQGPMLRDEAIVVTEANGRTIRHANAAFAKLVKLDLPSLRGKDIPDLLQCGETDRTVLRGIGAAIRARISATALVKNRNHAGEK